MDIQKPLSSTPAPIRLPHDPGSVRSASVAAPAPESAPTISHDKVHFSTRTNPQSGARISFVEAAPEASAQQDFGNAVSVNSASPKTSKKLLGYLSVTADQERQLKAAENRAFDRFVSYGYSPERGSLQAKIRQSAVDTYSPGYSLHNSALSINEGEKGQIKDALQKYGEDVASIAVTGRSRRDLQRYLEDKFFITVFDRDKEEFQDYFKNGFQNMMTDQASTLSAEQHQAPDGAPTAPSTESAPLPLPVPNDEQYKWRFMRPRVGVNVRGLDFEKVQVKPKVDLVQLRGPAQTEVRLTAEVPFEFNGKMYPEAEISARRMLNAKPGEYGKFSENIYAETRIHYNLQENRADATLGVRKQISPDSSMGVHGLYSQNFSGAEVKDIGVGVSYQSRFE
jgi:hypothetical protein